MKLINGHLNTIYSFLKSTIDPSYLVDYLEKNKQEYFSITEYNNFFSLAFFRKYTNNSSVKPIFGLTLNLWVNNNNYQYILYPKNTDGLYELYKLSSKALNNEKILLSEVILIKNIDIVEHPLYGMYNLTKQKFSYSNYYYSFEFNKIKENEEFIKENLNKCLIINHFCLFDEMDNSIINILNYISKDKTSENIYQALNFDFQTTNKFEEFLVTQTNDFLKDHYFKIEENKYIIPNFENKENFDATSYLNELIKKQIKIKFTKETWTKEYQDRLNVEINTIKKLKFENYFLIIQDWINWAKNQNILIGPGRGSSAGSLVCYLLNITEIDPLKHDLIFERFLNPERITMPDIDTDVQDNRRQEIIQYIVNKYGQEYVSNIVTFSTLGKKSAIRDVLRANKIDDSNLINKISKSISLKDEPLKEEIKTNKYLSKALDELPSKELQTKIIEETSKLEGLYRQTGTHAAGIIIGYKKLNEIIPTYNVETNMLQSQISMEYLEDFGLIKMDILGLKTLTTIKEILDTIKKNQNIDINLKTIKYNDQKTLDLLTSGNTLGIFQLESYGMIKAIKQVKIDSFNDIVAIISLYRPGPMDNLDSYALRKHKKEVIPMIHKDYDEILKSTYGIIIYQEQIMKIIQTVAKMSFSQADLIRRIISKKKIDDMQAIKDNFIESAINNNYSRKDAYEIFNNIEKFASYGFNKSHAVAYATLAYQLAYLKAHFPLEFYSSIISSAHGSHDNISKYVSEASNIGIKIESPEINNSYINATIKDNKIYLPLSMIKGMGPETSKLIIENREKHGPYSSFLHFMATTSLIKQFGLSSVELLIKANALRNFGYNQKTLLNEINDKNNELMLHLDNIKFNIEDNVEKLKKINYVPYEIIDDDFEYESNNESELLGQIYNFSLTKKYEIEGQRLIDLHINTEYLIYLYCSKIIKKQTKFGKDYFTVYLQDSSQKIVFNIWNNKKDHLLINNKIIKANIIKKDTNEYILKDWSIINESK